MSAINGDKARFHRARKKRIAQRIRYYELVKGTAQGRGTTVASKPKAAS